MVARVKAGLFRYTALGGDIGQEIEIIDPKKTR
jgi:hypothetical protein